MKIVGVGTKVVAEVRGFRKYLKGSFAPYWSSSFEYNFLGSCHTYSLCLLVKLLLHILFTFIAYLNAK